jgi:hypothetical protein
LDGSGGGVGEVYSGAEHARVCASSLQFTGSGIRTSIQIPEREREREKRLRVPSDDARRQQTTREDADKVADTRTMIEEPVQQSGSAIETERNGGRRNSV